MVVSPFSDYQLNRYGQYQIPTSDPRVFYNPNYGQYGGYSTVEDLGFNPSNALYQRYEDWARNNPIPNDPQTMGAVALRANPGTDPSYSGNSPDTLARLQAYDDAVAARSRAFQDLYQTPLSQLQYKTFSEAPSLEAYRNQLSSLGLELPLSSGDSTYFLRAASEQDPEVQRFGAQNVGLENYRNLMSGGSTVQNIEVVKQQADSGIEKSRQFLQKYVDDGKGQQTKPAINPRGENLGEVAQLNDLPPGPRGFDRKPGSYHKNNIIPIITPGSSYRPGEGFDIIDPFKNSPATQPGLSRTREEKYIASGKAAKAYRKGSSNTDPFGGAAQVG